MSLCYGGSKNPISGQDLERSGCRVDPHSVRTGIIIRERRGRFEIHKPGGEIYVKVEVEIGEMCLQSKEHQDL